MLSFLNKTTLVLNFVNIILFAQFRHIVVDLLGAVVMQMITACVMTIQTSCQIITVDSNTAEITCYFSNRNAIIIYLRSPRWGNDR